MVVKTVEALENMGIVRSLTFKISMSVPMIDKNNINLMVYKVIILILQIHILPLKIGGDIVDRSIWPYLSYLKIPDLLRPLCLGVNEVLQARLLWYPTKNYLLCIIICSRVSMVDETKKKSNALHRKFVII